jgi:hypothetical protein
MPPPVPGTVVGASAQVGPGGDTGSIAATGFAGGVYNAALTANQSLDCAGLLFITIRLIATAGATHVLTLNNLLPGAFINIELANTSGVTTTLKLAGTDYLGATLAGFVNLVGGTNADVIAGGLSQTNGLTLTMFGSMMYISGTPTLILTGVR